MTDKTISNDHQQLIDKTAGFVRNELKDAESGHDWYHIQRVWKNALAIATKEGQGDLLIIQLAALLHDIADAKFHNGDETIAPRRAGDFMRSLELPEDVIRHVIKIIENISFRKRNELNTFSSIELQIVQDADRLDAIGAIGIARVFNFGGYKNRPIFEPDGLTDNDIRGGQINNSNAPGNISNHTIGHFYEKLLLLSDLMNTQTGKKMARERHNFMVTFLDQFYKEWSSEL